MEEEDFQNSSRRNQAPGSGLKETKDYKDENQWEDVHSSPPSSVVSSTSATASRRRRRVARTRAVYLAAPIHPSSTRNLSMSRQPKSQQKFAASNMQDAGTDYHHDYREFAPENASVIKRKATDSNQLQEEWEQLKPNLRSILVYFVRVVADAFRWHRPFFSIALAFCMAYLVFSRIFSFTRVLTSPLCSVPLVNRAIPWCSLDLLNKGRRGDEKGAKWADYPKLMEMQTLSFEQLLDESVGGSGLALEVKKAEMATSDLATLVRVSSLSGRDVLAQILVKFVDDAKKTGRGLQTLSAKINGAVDSVLAVNEYALNTIEAASAPRSLLSRVLDPSSLIVRNPTKDTITDVFTNSMTALSKAMERCIVAAQVSLMNLDRLEEHLSLLHEMVSREDIIIHLEKSEVLAELWTWLGGNRQKLQGLDNHLALLKGIDGYRKKAHVYVASTLQALGALSADMEELRSRVAAPELVGDKIPVEVHIRSIKGGLERLKVGQMRAMERQELIISGVLSS